MRVPSNQHPTSYRYDDLPEPKLTKKQPELLYRAVNLLRSHS
jgi:hypothetical protein